VKQIWEVAMDAVWDEISMEVWQEVVDEVRLLKRPPAEVSHEGD